MIAASYPADVNGPTIPYGNTAYYRIDTRITYSGRVVIRTTTGDMTSPTADWGWDTFSNQRLEPEKPDLSNEAVLRWDAPRRRYRHQDSLLDKKAIARLISMAWNRKCIEETREIERRALAPVRERAPRHRVHDARRYIRPVSKGRVCASSSRYRTLMR